MSEDNHNHPDCSPTASAQLKLYQSMIFLIPVCIVFIVLYFLYLCWRRMRVRARWSSAVAGRAYSMENRGSGMRQSDTRVSEMGLMKELREMLPVIVFKESFAVKDTQCSVCLGDYQAEDKLQLIPTCGHSFHMDCIGSWLSNHSTCPLCRLSLLPAAKTEEQTPRIATETEEHASQDNTETERPQQTVLVVVEVLDDEQPHFIGTVQSVDLEAGNASTEQENNRKDHT